MEFKRLIVSQYGWSLHDIDETDACNLISFVVFTPDKATLNVREIDGRMYKKTNKPPSWL